MEQIVKWIGTKQWDERRALWACGCLMVCHQKAIAIVSRLESRAHSETHYETARIAIPFACFSEHHPPSLNQFPNASQGQTFVKHHWLVSLQYTKFAPRIREQKSRSQGKPREKRRQRWVREQERWNESKARLALHLKLLSTEMKMDLCSALFRIRMDKVEFHSILSSQHDRKSFRCVLKISSWLHKNKNTEDDHEIPHLARRAWTEAAIILISTSFCMSSSVFR